LRSAAPTEGASRVNEQLGAQFVKHVAAHDAAGLTAMLSDDIDFKALTPRRFWEAASPAEIVDDVIFGHWFKESDHIDAVESIETDTVVDRHRVGYRLHITNTDGAFAVEQQAYYEVRDGQISWLRIMCAGYQPVVG
jgi:hypothetical protein